MNNCCSLESHLCVMVQTSANPHYSEQIFCFQFGKPKSLNKCEARCGLVVSCRGRTLLFCRHVQNSRDLTMGTRVTFV